MKNRQVYTSRIFYLIPTLKAPLQKRCFSSLWHFSTSREYFHLAIDVTIKNNTRVTFKEKEPWIPLFFSITLDRLFGKKWKWLTMLHEVYLNFLAQLHCFVIFCFVNYNYFVRLEILHSFKKRFKKILCKTIWVIMLFLFDIGKTENVCVRPITI